jgi:hypothetical protein
MDMVQSVPLSVKHQQLTHSYRSLTSPKSAKAGAEAACEPEFSLFRSSLPAALRTALFFGALYITL